ncbi:hypothetical protein [Glycomyces arizonensis]|uniref:hypothetical protein n=1 Tax=Glycomyces arizonensis TaxID=256035 RepID=UPI00047BB928|nr:hypothetical protein [Glycomyces arizonensis]
MRLFAQLYILIQVFNIAPMLNAGADFSVGRALSGAVCGAVVPLAVFPVIVRSTYFKYDLHSMRIGAGNRWGVRRSYPRPGYDRLEFSPVYGEIREVATDGRRHRVPVAAAWADREDWREFMEGFYPAVRATFRAEA